MLRTNHFFSSKTALCCLAVIVQSVFSITIKLGSLAPTNSTWDVALRAISAKWTETSNGEVIVKVYAGGIAGDEENMIRKMRINQLEAAAMSGVGLCRIHNSILAIHSPMLIRNDKELWYVLEKMKPNFERDLEAKGFKVLFWSKIGWAHFFSKREIVKPEDLKTHKLFNYAGDPDGTQVWKNAGFNPIPLSPSELMTGLQSGMVDAFTATALSAASYQWFNLTPNMCSLNWAPLLGGVVITNATWNKIPAQLKTKLITVVDSIGKQLQIDIDKADTEALTSMKQHGLKINSISSENENQWNGLVSSNFNSVVGKSFDAATYEQIKQLLKEYRQGNASKNSRNTSDSH